MNTLKFIFRAFVLASLSIVYACEQDEYLPPDYNYDIPQTALKSQTQLGAFYSIKSDNTWASAQGYTPLLNIVYEESGEPAYDGENLVTTPYTSTSDGVLTQQCAWAAEAGIDFFIIPWNGGATEQGLVDNFAFYYTQETKVKLVINYNFAHLKLTALSGEGADFEAVVADFKALYASLFSKEWYYRMPDGRPILILPGNESTSYDYSLFIPAFRQAMRDFMQELQLADNPDGASVSDQAMDFYIIGENTSNWVAPQVNEAAARHLDGNYCRKWYPTTYYERWYCFYPFTDMAWENWRDYASGWGNDFIPCIYPEYYTTEKGARSIERTTENYTDFCNVAKRNIGSQQIVLINSWNDFANDAALEPTLEYEKTYLDITRKQLKRQ